MHPVQAEKIQARTGRHAAHLIWSARGIEHWQIDPVQIELVAGGPDDAANPDFCQIQLGSIRYEF